MSVRSVQNMTLDGAGVNRSFSPTSDLVGDFEAIATVTVGSGGASSITFSSIPSTYKHLQLRTLLRSTRAVDSDDYVGVRFNGDSTSSYFRHMLNGTGASVISYGDSQTYGYLNSAATASGAASNIFASAVIDILDYTNTSKNTTTRAHVGHDQNNSNGRVNISSFLWPSTSAVSSVTLFCYANFAQHSTAALYGVRA